MLVGGDSGGPGALPRRYPLKPPPKPPFFKCGLGGGVEAGYPISENPPPVRVQALVHCPMVDGVWRTNKYCCKAIYYTLVSSCTFPAFGPQAREIDTMAATAVAVGREGPSWASPRRPQANRPPYVRETQWPLAE